MPRAIFLESKVELSRKLLLGLMQLLKLQDLAENPVNWSVLGIQGVRTWILHVSREQRSLEVSMGFGMHHRCMSIGSHIPRLPKRGEREVAITCIYNAHFTGS